MWKIGNFYILKDSEMQMINWWLTLLDRHREQDEKRWRDRVDKENHEADL